MVQKISTDGIMTRSFLCLVSDFRTSLGQNYAARQTSAFLSGGIKSLRSESFPGRMAVSPFIFKRDYQLETFFKRYRFEKDVFSDDELNLLSVQKFLDTQIRLQRGIYDSPLTNMVLRRARHITKQILGKYDLEEHRDLCRFGKRACVGTRYSESTLDTKVSRPLTGSLAHIRWFKSYLETDRLLRLAIREASGKKRPSYRMCDTLTVSHVPKSFKALRAICPDTLLGSFYTAGLGRLIADRLKSVGLDITKLQKQHGYLAMRSSVSRWQATADLSAASDSLTGPLLMKVLPLPWYRAVMFGRIPHVSIGGQTVRMNTVLTMGLGHTFPLQTLVFYSLVEAIRQLSEVDGRVSVYGDDLIYPRKLHRYIRVLFPQFQLLLNEDKTYVQDFFRESCGSDYYRGCDVRPFSMEGECHHFSGIELEEFIYKLYNGLLRRWSREEIPKTIEFLTQLLILHCESVLVVPPHFPDTSGIKVGTFEDECGFYAPLKPCYPFHSVWFNYLTDGCGRKRVTSQAIYYWEKLRQSDVTDELDNWSSINDTPILYWQSSTCKKTGVKRLTPQVVDKRRRVVRYARSSTTEFGLLLQKACFADALAPQLSGRELCQVRVNPWKWVKRGWRGGRLT